MSTLPRVTRLQETRVTTRSEVQVGREVYKGSAVVIYIRLRTEKGILGLIFD